MIFLQGFIKFDQGISAPRKGTDKIDAESGRIIRIIIIILIIIMIIISQSK